MYMLFAVRIVKNCDQVLENAALGLRPRAAVLCLGSVFHYTADPMPVNNLFIFPPSQIIFIIVDLFQTHCAHITVTVGRDRKIQTALRANQISEFVIVNS